MPDTVEPTGGLSRTEPRPSLIQQRMQLDRDLFGSRWALCGGTVFTALSLARYVSSGTGMWWDLVGVAVGLGLLAVGLIQRRNARRAVAEFEAAHGRDAGRQQPVR